MRIAPRLTCKGFPRREFSELLGAKAFRVMPSAVNLREDFSAEDLRAPARRSKAVNHSRRLLSVAAVCDGMERGEAAKIGGMGRRRCAIVSTASPFPGRTACAAKGERSNTPRLSPEQLAEFAKLAETGPDLEAGGVVRRRRADLKRVIVERFGVAYQERTVGRLLPKLGFSP